MSDAVEQTPPAPEDVEVNHNRDWLLANLVAIAESGVEFSVVLHVQGSIVLGQLISGRTYFEKLAEQFRSGENDLGDALGELMDEGASIYPEPGSQVDLQRAHQVGFVHLRNARTYIGDGEFSPSDGSLWRGRISSISGFSFGKWKSSPD